MSGSAGTPVNKRGVRVTVFLKGRVMSAAIASQAGWSGRAVTKMVETYAHAVNDRRLDEIERLPTPSRALLEGEAAHVSERETLT